MGVVCESAEAARAWAARCGPQWNLSHRPLGEVVRGHALRRER